MDWTDVHYRQLARLISRRTWLWTEMVVDKTLLHTPQPDRHLWFPPEQRPIVLQLGGSDPETLAAAALIAAPYGYDEINLNCGCPSDRVAGAGCFGAALMLTPQLVADCMAAVRRALDGGGYAHVPLSVKCRLGVDDADSYGQLVEFVRAVSEAGGVRHFVVHARKCLLSGLSPAQNRSVPPLRHEWVWALKRDFPHLFFSLNGGVQNAHEAAGALAAAHGGVAAGAASGVMIGRAAYYDPWGVLGDADVAVFGAASNPARSRRAVLDAYCDYADAMLGRWAVKDDGHRDPSARAILKPALNLFYGERGSKRWKAAMDAALKAAPKDASVRSLLAATLAAIPPEVLDAPPAPAAAVAAIAAAGANVRTLPAAAPPPAAAEGAEAEAAAAERAAARAAVAAARPPALPLVDLTKPAPGPPPRWNVPEGVEAPGYSALRGPLPGPEDRAAGEDEERRRRAKQQKRKAAAGDANGGGGGLGADQQQQQQQAEQQQEVVAV